MALHPHPTGGYRAYKKIGGKEFQYYSRDLASAEKKQAEFEALSKLRGRPVFSSCGRMKGCRITLYKREGREPVIIGKVATGPFRQQRVVETRYNGCFSELWCWLKETWKEAYQLTSKDVAHYGDALRAAKRLYIRDLGLLEEQLK
ncbi:MAG: hypothetical protein C9356_14900 [Oleiphilus sp.]|nr:MAG: hypothetical protein C9356_14900 [Oleiphilus sp.]